MIHHHQVFRAGLRAFLAKFCLRSISSHFYVDGTICLSGNCLVIQNRLLNSMAIWLRQHIMLIGISRRIKFRGCENRAKGRYQLYSSWHRVDIAMTWKTGNLARFVWKVWGIIWRGDDDGGGWKTKVFLIRSARGLDDGELYLRRLFEENFYFPPEYKLGIARGPQMKLLKHQTEETFLLHPSFEATFLHLASRLWLQNQDHNLIKIVIMVDMVEVHVLRRFYKRIKSKQFMIVAHIWMHKRYQFVFTSLMICWII